MDLPRERGERDAVSHGERELHDQLPRPAAYDRRAEDAAVGARDDLREPDGRAVHDRPVELAEARARSEEHTSELQSPCNLVCRLLLEKKISDTMKAVKLHIPI